MIHEYLAQGQVQTPLTGEVKVKVCMRGKWVE